MTLEFTEKKTCFAIGFKRLEANFKIDRIMLKSISGIPFHEWQEAVRLLQPSLRISYQLRDGEYEEQLIYFRNLVPESKLPIFKVGIEYPTEVMKKMIFPHYAERGNIQLLHRHYYGLSFEIKVILEAYPYIGLALLSSEPRSVITAG